MTKSALVIGGAGYIGSNTAKALKSSGILPIVIDDLSAGFAHNVNYGPFVKANMNDTAAISAAIKEYKPSTVLHFAACIEVGEGEKDPLKFYNNNVANAVALFDTIISNGVKNIVFSSTCATYGVPQSNFLSETHVQNPISTYGRTKLMVEWILKDLSKANGINFSALRYFNASGADADGELGEEHQPETHLIPNVLAAIEGKRDGLQVFGSDYDTPDGTCVRDFIHVADLAIAHVNAANYIESKNENLILNLGTGTGTSVIEVIKTAERVTGKPCPYEVFPRREGDPPYLVADGKLAKEKIGFNPTNSDIENIIKTAYNFHLSKWNAK